MTLKTISPETLVKMSGNEMIDFWKANAGLDLWYEIGVLGKAIARSRKIKTIDKLKALVSIAELEMKFKKTRSKEKGGEALVIMTRDPTKP